MTDEEYRRGAVLLLVSVLLLAAAVLAEVLATLFFATTVAYVLYPFRRQLVGRGLPRRVASGSLTAGVFVAVLAVVAPVLNVVYRRREDIAAVLGSLPDTLVLEGGGFEYAVETTALETALAGMVRQFAIDVAEAAPTLAMKGLLFVTVVYALLLAPSIGRRLVRMLVPPSYEGVVYALHGRVRSTLYAIYGLQATMGVLAFLVGFVLFWALGYEVAFVLAVVAGLLQFLPVIGPMLLVALLGGFELLLGDPARGVVVVVVGVAVFWIGLDTVVRPQLARRTANLPGSLYLTGFVGGLLSLGPVGFVAGPLVVAVVVEVVELVAVEIPEGVAPADASEVAAREERTADDGEDGSEPADADSGDDPADGEDSGEPPDAADGGEPEDGDTRGEPVTAGEDPADPARSDRTPARRNPRRPHSGGSSRPTTISWASRSS